MVRGLWRGLGQVRSYVVVRFTHSRLVVTALQGAVDQVFGQLPGGVTPLERVGYQVS